MDLYSSATCEAKGTEKWCSFFGNVYANPNGFFKNHQPTRGYTGNHCTISMHLRNHENFKKMKHKNFTLGGICPGGSVLGGFYPGFFVGGFMSGGFSPRGFCPRTINIP